jgi:hypothetical protein
MKYIKLLGIEDMHKLESNTFFLIEVSTYVSEPSTWMGFYSRQGNGVDNINDNEISVIKRWFCNKQDKEI